MISRSVSFIACSWILSAGSQAIPFDSVQRKSMSSQAKFKKPKIISQAVHDYVLQKGFNEDSVVEELRLSTANHPRSVMMGDPVEAAMFKVLLPAIGAKKILEVGVFTGYTTLVMAQAIGKDGKIVGLDINNDFVSIAKPYWEKAGVSDQIEMRFAPAKDSMKDLLDEGHAESFDFIFIDADKVNYKVYYDIGLQLLRKNGIIAIDNVLWNGKVLDEATFQDEDTVAIREVTDFVQNDDRVDHVLLPFADGVTLVRKK